MESKIKGDHLGELESTNQYLLKGTLFGGDLLVLESSIRDAYENKKITRLVVDISDADTIRFKANRLFSICQYYGRANIVEERGLSFQLVVSEEQMEIFDEINEIKKLGDFAIKIRKETQKEHKETSARGSSFINLLPLPDRWILAIKYFVSKIQPNHLIDYLVRPLFFLCLFLFIEKLIFLDKTLFGFVILVVSGVFCFELFIVMKIYNSQKRRVKIGTRVVLSSLYSFILRAGRKKLTGLRG